MKIKGDNKGILKYKTKKKVFIKFLLVLFVFLAYFIFISLKYGLSQGFLITILTWSFFVLCTPIADAGFLIDFPLRLILKVRMFFSEMTVWTIAISINIYTFLFNPEIYQTNKLLDLFYHILKNPIPFWLIIIVSGTGTFLSVHFGDELLDKVNHKERKSYHKHKSKYHLIVFLAILLLIFVLYDFLLKKLGVIMPF